ncbi:MAG: TrbI/VirB10 family protein [Pseudomonadota bacterium]
MDNKPPFSDDNNSSQSSHDFSQEVDDDVVIKNNSAINKKNMPIIVIAVGLMAFGIYMFSSIFGEPEKTKGPNPLEVGDKTVKVAAGSKKDNANDITATTGVDLPQPPVAILQPPPPAEPLNNYAPPPIAPPVQLDLDSSKNNNTLAGITRVPTISDEPPPPPPLPALVPPTPEITNIGKSKTVNTKDKDTKKRIRSNMMVLDGGKSSSSSSARTASPTNDPNSTFADNVLKATTAEKAVATGLSNLNMTIAQGKIINAVLETAINTDLPGTLRAIVSRDTYAETGRTVLIPKGSRLIGTYNTGVLQGQNRVMIVWTRVIRPDGIDIMIGSPGVDELGRAGAAGHVDNKLFDIFSSAILTTIFTIAAAAGSDAILPVQNGQSSTTTTNPNGNTTTTSSPAQQAAANAVTDFGNTGKQVVQRLVDVRPTITIDQGTLVNVFVNRDLTFPSNLDGGVFIQ